MDNFLKEKNDAFKKLTSNLFFFFYFGFAASYSSEYEAVS